MASHALTPAPLWKAIRDQLLTELPQYEYGSSFYTIDDICRKFEVSIITARRVLDELASEGLVEKIRKRGTVVRRSTRSTLIRLVIAADSPTGYEKFSVHLQRQVMGAIRFAQQHHIDFDILSESHLEMLFARDHESIGLLLRPGVSTRTIEFLRSRRLPLVMLDPIEEWRNLPHVRTDRRQAGYLAARRLIELGHRRIGYILGAISRRNFRHRILGYRQALQEAGLKFDWKLIQETDGEHPEQDVVATNQLLNLRQPATAIMTGDDGRALRALAVCRARGLRVPQDISILAYPGYPESKLSDPPLSIVDGRAEEVGFEAMRLLMSLIYEKPDRRKHRLLIQPALVERQSTGPAPSSMEPSPLAP